ncbi:hypothetical protein Tco_0769223 [Tanacetum coccineum]|uniref:Uncharacterized protein n=1 Tax=Tanacetum coccineum TaxID=301880 RepID=A0ABQ4ZBN5_9ASTR
MEILLVSSSNSTTVGDLRSSNENKLVQLETLSRRLRRDSYNPITAESDSLPHSHAQATKTYYMHQDSRIKKAQVQSHRLPQL